MQEHEQFWPFKPYSRFQEDFDESDEFRKSSQTESLFVVFVLEYLQRKNPYDGSMTFF